MSQAGSDHLNIAANFKSEVQANFAVRTVAIRIIYRLTLQSEKVRQAA